MKKDKSRLILIAIFMLIPLAVALLYGIGMMNKEELNSGEWFPLVIVVLLILFMFIFLGKRYKAVKDGMPIEDEMSFKIKTRAASTSFYITLYWLLAISMFESFFAKIFFGADTLTASQTVGGGVAGMSLIFFICWFYFSKRGADKPQRTNL